MRSFALSYSDHIAWNTKISHDIHIIVIVIIIIRIKINYKQKQISNVLYLTGCSWS